MALPPRTALSLCSGYGGLDLGCELVWPGLRTVGYVEREAFAASVLLARMEDEALERAPIWCGDLAELPVEPFAGRVDLVTAGFPCQPWSVAGSRKGTDDERWIWDDIVGLVRAIRPRWLVLENVPGLVSGGGLGPVVRDLAVLGFTAEWGLLRADAVGASHRRERWFCVAVSDRGGRNRQGLHLPGRGQEQPVLDAAGAGNDLAGRELLEGWDRTGEAWATGRPLHAPGPADLDLWARVLAQAPEVEPSLCGVSPRDPGWMDDRAERLRACGNGVVPLQAGVAIRLLVDRLGV